MVPRRRSGEDEDMHVPNGGVLGLFKTILTTAGPVALIATLLCGFLMYAVWGRFDRLDASNEQLGKQMASAGEGMRAFAEKTMLNDKIRDDLLASQIKILRQMCINSARTELQTRACLQE